MNILKRLTDNIGWFKSLIGMFKALLIYYSQTAIKYNSL